MANNIFEMNMFDGQSLCFEFKSIIVCNKNIKDALLEGYVEIEAPTPYVIITDDRLTDDEIEILEDASIADCLKLNKAQPAFGGVIV